ncbi:MAG: hypothetical protein JWR22_3817 [Herminiimonas sp.]|nr:hypothetical protein [Herminiimonas sp.]
MAKFRNPVVAALMWGWLAVATAQPASPDAGPSAPKPSIDPGAVVTPPNTDSRTIRKPPGNIDPGMVETPPTAKESADSKTGPKKKPKDPDCAGSVASCNKAPLR